MYEQCEHSYGRSTHHFNLLLNCGLFFFNDVNLPQGIGLNKFVVSENIIPGLTISCTVGLLNFADDSQIFATCMAALFSEPPALIE